MEQLREFEKEPNQNWLKGVVALFCLQKSLERFIDEEIGSFHRKLVNECGEKPCEKNCNFNNWKPQQNQSPPLCDVCSFWRASILDNRTSGKLMWVNSKPDLWSQDQWEVAKVYMPHGHKNHHSIGDFDIAALLCLMNQCKHFKKFELGGLCEKVSEVRNKIMHAPRLQLKQEDFLDYFNRIRELGEVLGKRVPEFKSLSKDIDEIQNRDCRMIFPDDVDQKTVKHLAEMIQAIGNKVMVDDELKKLLMMESSAKQHLPRLVSEVLQQWVVQKMQRLLMTVAEWRAVFQSEG